MNEQEPPLEITLKWFQSHDKFGQGVISFKEFQLTVTELIELIFTEKSKRRNLDFLQWNFVGKITKTELKSLAKGIYQSVSRSSPGIMNSGEFDHGICQLAEKLNTRQPDLKLTRMLQTKYKLEGDKITQKEFIHVIKRLCGFQAQLQKKEQSQGKIIVELQQIDFATLTEIQLVIDKQGQQAKGRVILSQFSDKGRHELNWKFESFTPSLQLKGEIEFL